MRVIAGVAKGARLAPVPGGVRPLSDRAREGLFSSLGGAVRGARVLDLYAGTGAVGIEALSRGADHATFVDSDRASIRAVRSNLERTGLSDRASALTRDVLAFLSKAPSAPAALAFLDPPYVAAPNELEDALAVLTAGWLAPGFTAVLTRPTRSSTLVTPVNWHVARRLQYGDSLVILYREV